MYGMYNKGISGVQAHGTFPLAVVCRQAAEKLTGKAPLPAAGSGALASSPACLRRCTSARVVGLVSGVQAQRLSERLEGFILF